MTNPTALRKLTVARSQLLINKGQGFWGVLALRLKLAEKPEIPTLAVDGKHIFYNPEFIMSISDSLVRSAMAHEVMHCVFDHIGRRGARTPRRWNQAGDFAINLVLDEAGFEIGENWLLSKSYAGMTADQIYNMLPEDNGDDGNDPLDEIMDAPAIDGSGPGAESNAVEWKIAAIQAANAAKAADKLPGGLERFIEDTTTNKVDWRAALRQFVTEISKNDYSWSRPNRRFLSVGMYLPGLYSESMGEVAVVIDTSGSIDQATLNAFGSEVKAIVESVKPLKTHVIYCDSEVNHVDEFTPEQELHFAMHGGGCTDFAPPFIHLEKNDIKPSCLIYLTDLCGPFPDAPEFPVLWVCTTDFIAPFGQTIPIQL